MVREKAYGHAEKQGLRRSKKHPETRQETAKSKEAGITLMETVLHPSTSYLHKVFGRPLKPLDMKCIC